MPDNDVYPDPPRHKVEVEIHHDFPHPIAVEYEWEGFEGVQILGMFGAAPKLIVTITNLGVME